MNSSPSPAPVWGPERRSWVSLLLFMHLFALVVGVTTYTRPSGLQEQLHELFAPYLRNLHMTAYPVSYPFARFYLTHALQSDVDYTCEVDLTGPAGKTETIVLPSSGLQPLVRKRRYQALANAAGTLSEGEGNDNFSSILPKSIAGSVLKAHAASAGVIRCRAHLLPDMDTMEDVNAGKLTPEVRTAYEAQVFVSSSGVELLKKTDKLEVAPLNRPAATGDGPQRPGKSVP